MDGAFDGRCLCLKASECITQQTAVPCTSGVSAIDESRRNLSVREL
jgi:hypothetical protein